MKAKELYDNLIEETLNNPEISLDYKDTDKFSGFSSAVIDKLIFMINEVQDIAKMRNAKSDNALIAIFKEQILKSKSFLKMVNNGLGYEVFRDNSFILVVKSVSPDLYEVIEPHL